MSNVKYVVTSPSGERYKVIKLKEFFRQHKLKDKNLPYPNVGETRKWKGWRIRHYRIRSAEFVKYWRFRKPENMNSANGRAVRTCLKCGNEFKSDWIGNRICANCKDRNKFLSSSLDG